MDPEGMVHALEITHGLLRKDGILINIQPAGRRRSLEIHTAGKISRAGPIGHRLNHALHKAALEAMAQVVRDGLYILEHERTIHFLYHAPSLPVFEQWLAEKSENSILEDGTARRARRLWEQLGQECEVVMREQIYIGRLRPG